MLQNFLSGEGALLLLRNGRRWFGVLWRLPCLAAKCTTHYFEVCTWRMAYFAENSFTYGRLIGQKH